MSSADDFFSGGSPSAKFDSIGVVVAGPITRVGEPMQQKDFTTGAPKFWDDGKPMMQLPVDVRTDLRDPEIVNDDGTRTLYVKGELQKAIRTAVRQAGVTGLRIGGQLSVTYTGDGVAKQRGMNPPKLYTAAYTAPTAAKGDHFLNGGNGGNAADQATPATTAPAAANAGGATGDAELEAALAALPPEQAAAMRAAGITAQQLRAMGLANAS